MRIIYLIQFKNMSANKGDKGEPIKGELLVLLKAGIKQINYICGYKLE